MTRATPVELMPDSNTMIVSPTSAVPTCVDFGLTPERITDLKVTVYATEPSGGGPLLLERLSALDRV